VPRHPKYKTEVRGAHQPDVPGCCSLSGTVCAQNMSCRLVPRTRLLAPACQHLFLSLCAIVNWGGDAVGSARQGVLGGLGHCGICRTLESKDQAHAHSAYPSFASHHTTHACIGEPLPRLPSSHPRSHRSAGATR
jgi:hypothetical protein